HGTSLSHPAPSPVSLHPCSLSKRCSDSPLVTQSARKAARCDQRQQQNIRDTKERTHTHAHTHSDTYTHTCPTQTHTHTQSQKRSVNSLMLLVIQDRKSVV